MGKTSKTVPCSVEGCVKFSRNRGWCSAHYERWRVHGSPTYEKWESVEQRFWTKVDKTSDPDGCWQWIGGFYHTGYGVFSVNYRDQAAHRYSYELHTGQDLGSLHIDHLCFNRSCVNPAHLRAVTQQQNNEHKQGAQSNNLSSGIRGVTWHKNAKRWIAQVEHNGKNHYAGSFESVHDAAEAARLKRNELFTHNDRDRMVG